MRLNNKRKTSRNYRIDRFAGLAGAALFHTVQIYHLPVVLWYNYLHGWRNSEEDEQDRAA